jgi:hypothetical protein
MKKKPTKKGFRIPRLFLLSCFPDSHLPSATMDARTFIS